MTIKLYEKNVYEKICTSSVIDLVEKDGKKFVVLDKTLFFPEGGGQPSDIGYINNSKVKYVFEKTGVIFHEVDEFPSEKNVECKLNWNKRLDSMQQHCGEHILSGIIYREYKGINKGFHLGEDYVTIDIDIENITEEMKENIEERANLAIYQNSPVKTVIVNNKDEAKKYNLRKEITVDSNIRVVNIENTDSVACCGTHPSKTGEVGLIKILKIEKNKGMSRIYFKCGKRALEDYKIKHNLILKINNSYSANESNLMEKIQNEKTKYDALKENYKSLKNLLMDKWIEDNCNSKSPLISATEEFDSSDFKSLCKKMTEKNFSHEMILYSKNDFSIIACNFEKKDLNWGKIFKENMKKFNGAGGGNSDMAQGKFKTEKNLLEFVEYISTLLTSQ